MKKRMVLFVSREIKFEKKSRVFGCGLLKQKQLETFVSLQYFANEWKGFGKVSKMCHVLFEWSLFSR